MFTSLRWRLTFWFVILTTIVYTISAACGMWLFKTGTIRVIDDELAALADELEPTIAIKHERPNLKKWAEISSTMPFRFLPTIQLYDPDGNLIEQHGPVGVPILFAGASELKKDVKSDFYHIRVYSEPIVDQHHKLIGFLQLQLSLRNIERATAQFGMDMGWLAPFLLLALAISGYVFSGVAARPLERSFAALKRFMTDAGHELSTPLSIIQANAEALEVELPDDGRSKNRIGVIVSSTERMANLVNDLMLLAKMESPQLISKRTALDFSTLVKSTVQEFEELFKNRSIALNMNLAETAPIIGDSDALKRLITNLLQNALRYTGPGGTVNVDVENLGRIIKLTVTDTGMGIPPESLPFIFDRFYRVDKSRSRNAGGSGLGLSIVKAIIESHKGKIEVHSQVALGTTLTVLLPGRG
jgi:OmpR-family two-component system manganese-sensing sensor histidine kinase